MKLWISMLILALSVVGFCIWEGVYTNRIFQQLEQESEYIYTAVQTEQFGSDELTKKIYNLNETWTKKMDILSISISRKDLQPVSDYIQYLVSSTFNNNQEDAITYARLLWYNIVGISEVVSFSSINLL